MKPNRLDYPSQGWGESLFPGGSSDSLAKCPKLEAGQKAPRRRGREEAPVGKWLIYKELRSQSPMASLLHFVLAIRRKVRHSAVAK